MRHNNNIARLYANCNDEKLLQKGYYVSVVISRYASLYIYILGKNNFDR